MLEFQELTKDDIIFSYQTGPILGTEGEEGGFSITLYGNGNLRYCTYTFFEKIQQLEMYKVSKEMTEDIYCILRQNDEVLKRMPKRLDNGSTKGDSHEFQFLGVGNIVAWNIHKSVLVYQKLFHRSHYAKYHQMMEWENQLLGIFEEICACFYGEGFRLSLGKCVVKEAGTIRIKWEELGDPNEE